MIANYFIQILSFCTYAEKRLSSPKSLDNLAKECLLPKHEKHDNK